MTFQYLIQPDYADYYGLVDYVKIYYSDVQHYYGDIVITTPHNVFHEIYETVKRYVKNVAIIKQIGTPQVMAVTPNQWHIVTVQAHNASDMMLVRDLFCTYKPVCDADALTVRFYQTSPDCERLSQYIAERTGSDRKISVVPVYYGDTRRRNVYKVAVSDSQYAAVSEIARFMDVYNAPKIQRGEITFTANLKLKTMRKILGDIGEMTFTLNGKKTYKVR
jgi:hypothetical protein